MITQTSIATFRQKPGEMLNQVQYHMQTDFRSPLPAH